MTRSFETLTLLMIGTVAIGLIYLSEFSGKEVDFERSLVPPPERPELYSLGYNENISDSLWIRLIQDIDYCDALHDDVAKSRDEIKGDANAKVSACHSKLGWSYRMLNAITELTPKFRMPYNHGATVLSITVGDTEGAKRIFDRGVENFPNDWSLQFRAAYHYLYEVHDDKKAAELLDRAGKNGAPPWVFSLAARLYTKEGKAELAKSVLQSALDEDPDSKYAVKLKYRLRQLNNIIAGKPEDADENKVDR